MADGVPPAADKLYQCIARQCADLPINSPTTETPPEPLFALALMMIWDPRCRLTGGHPAQGQ